MALLKKWLFSPLILFRNPKIAFLMTTRFSSLTAAVEIDISDRLADRLEAARQRAIVKSEPVMTLEHEAPDVRD